MSLLAVAHSLALHCFINLCSALLQIYLNSHVRCILVDMTLACSYFIHTLSILLLVTFSIALVVIITHCTPCIIYRIGLSVQLTGSSFF